SPAGRPFGPFGCRRRTPPPDGGRPLGVDDEPLRALPGLQAVRRRPDGVQREVNGQPARAPRRLVRHAPLAHPPELPELLARRHPLPDDRNPTREGALSAYNARSDEELASTLPVVAPGRRAGRGGSRAFRAGVPDGDLRL